MKQDTIISDAVARAANAGVEAAVAAAEILKVHTPTKKTFRKGSQLSLAILIATQRHDGVYDRGGNPYILHTLKVMHYLKTDNELQQAGAVLHDVVEDTFDGDHEAGYQYLAERGVHELVIDFVRCLTNVEGESFEDKVKRICKYKETIEIKLCDVRHNSDIRRLKGLTDKDFKRMQGYQTLYKRLEEELENWGDGV